MASKTGAVVAPFKEIETFKDYPVQDASSRRIGSAGVFFRAEGGPQFLEVILRGLLGKTSKLVPWELARVHDQEKRIVLSCGREDVEDAPDFDRDEPITLERARRTRAHYGLLEDMASLEPTAVREQPAAADTERSRQDGDQLPGRRLANDLQAQVQGLGGPSAPSTAPAKPALPEEEGERVSVTTLAPAPAAEQSDTGEAVEVEQREPTDELPVEEEEAFRLGSRWLPVWHPAFDVVDQPDHYRVILDLPGVPLDAIELDLREDVLTVAGERGEETNMDFHRRERPTGRFIRRFHLPRGVTPAGVEAKLESGVLELRIPKPKQQEAQKITLRLEHSER